MAKKNKATAITKHNIQEAFWSFYKNMPMEKIRINAVMDRAGYNRGTFYEYFKSLDDVLESIEMEIYSDFVVRLQSLIDGTTTGAEMLLDSVDIVMANRDRFVVLLGENGDSKFRESLVNGTAKVIDGQFRQKIEGPVDFDNIDAYKYFVDFVANGMWGTLVKWASDQTDYNENMRDDMLGYFDGVARVAEKFCTDLLNLG